MVKMFNFLMNFHRNVFAQVVQCANNALVNENTMLCVIQTTTRLQRLC